MDVKLPVYYLSKAILPSFNALVSMNLKERGLSEGRIATILGLTQPAVNLHIKKGRKWYLDRLKEVGLSEPQIMGVVERATDSLLRDDLEEAMKVYLELLGSGLLCKHHRAVAGLPESCDICMRLFGSGRKEEREELVYRVREALKILERSKRLADLLPQVRSNLVARLDRAVTEEDVAGIPGRLTEVKGKVVALHPPEFGASRHVARVLLEISKVFPKVKAAMNLKYDGTIKECIEKLGWRCISVKIKEEDLKEKDPVIAALKRALKEKREAIDGFYHEAFYGLEASLYLFAEDPIELAEKVLALANLCARTSSSSS